MNRRTTIIYLLALLVPVLGGAVAQGCISRSEGSAPAIVVQVTDAITALLLPGGPDAIGGIGSGTSGDLGDYVMANQHIRAVIDQPGTDPTSLGGLFPLTNVLAPTGGTLVDLAGIRSDNDQWNQMGQGVVGFVTVITGTSGTADASPNVFLPPPNDAFDIFLDPTVNFTTAGVQDGDTLTILSDVNAGRSYRIASVAAPTVLVIFRAQGVPYDDDDIPPLGAIDYMVTHTSSPLENIITYDSAAIIDAEGDPAILRVSGFITNAGTIPDGCGVNPANGHLTEAVSGSDLTVETDYMLFRDAHYLSVETRITNPGSSGVSIYAVADLIITGGTSVANIAPWTPLAGYAAFGLDSPVIVPFVSFRGRDEPEASYTEVDPQAGQMIHAADGTTIAANIQLSPPGSIAASGALAWLRHIAVGERNDVASSADQAVALLGSSIVRVNPVGPSNIPNGFKAFTEIEGRVIGAPDGTTITAIQVDPALVFDPGPPSGLASEDGFFGSMLYGAPEIIMTQARPDEATGRFRMLVPRGFAGIEFLPTPTMTAPAGLEGGTENSTYRLVVEAPGHDPQSVLVRLPHDEVNNLVFDLRGETGTIDIVVTDDAAPPANPIPAMVFVFGMDPDGIGPTAATPDPHFEAGFSIGAGDADGDGILDESPPIAGNVFDPRATGEANVLHLVDGVATVEVAPGAYQVVATRGLEYTIGRFPPVTASTDFFIVAAGQTVSTSIALSRILDSGALPEPTVGSFASPLQRMIAGDFHVHSGRSFDSALPLEDRVTSYLSTGVELLVSTEHDNLVDLAPVVADLDNGTNLDLTTLLATQVGVEATGFVGVDVTGVLEFPNTIGHFNGWPLPVDGTLRRNGAPADEYRTPADLYEELRALTATLPLTPTSIVEMNHPRYPIAEAPLPPIGLGFLTNGKAGFAQPNTGAASLAAGGYVTPLRSSNTAIVPSNDGSLDDMNTVRTVGGTRYNSFDTFEVFGGVVGLYDIQRLDWYAMLSSGYIRTAVANSDSHTLTGSPGYPRTFVFTTGNGSTDVGTVDLNALNQALLPRLVQSTPGTTTPTTLTFFPAQPRTGAGTDDMEVICSSGIIVYVEIDADEDGTFEGQPGDLVAEDGDGSVDVRVTVLAAPWVPVDTVRIIVSGGNAAQPVFGWWGQTTDLTTDLLFAPYPTDAIGDPDFFSTALVDVVRLREVVSVALPNRVGIGPPFLSDDWLIVEARGTTSGSDPYDDIVPEAELDVLFGNPNTAIGFTNPIFIDRFTSPLGGGAPDGEFDPPGVP